MGSESVEKLRNEVLALFNSLVIFTAEEHKQRIDQIKNLPEKGLEQLRRIFSDAQVEQIKQMRQLFPLEPDLPKKMYVSMRKNGVTGRPQAAAEEESGPADMTGQKSKSGPTPTRDVVIQTPPESQRNPVQAEQKKSEK